MKILVQNYTFNAAAKTITFTDYTSLNLASLLLITNVTDNIIIYNFASSILGGSITNNVLTLDYDTSSMSNTDSLQIFIDDGSTSASNAVTLDEESMWMLRRMVKLMDSNAVTDSSNRQRVAVETVTSTTLGISVTGLSSGAGVPTVNDPTALAPRPAPSTTYWQPVWIGPVDQRYQIIDQARASYNLAIRNNITF